MNNIKYIEERAQGIAKYSNKLRQAIKDIDTEMTPYFKDAGIVVFDDEFKYEDNYQNTFRLGIFKAEYGQYAGQWGIYLEGASGDEIFVSETSRKALKQITMRIIPLLEKYSRILEQKEVEYKEIAEKAEAMAEAIRGH